MKDGTYGGNDTIVAFARLYNCTVVIHQPDAPRWEVHGCVDVDRTKAFSRQKYFHIAYLNGEHYCSVVPNDLIVKTKETPSQDTSQHSHVRILYCSISH